MKVSLRVIPIFLFLFISCQKTTKTESDIFGTADLNHANRILLEVAMEDGFPPPVASRVYVYPHIAHYITLQQFYPDSLPAIDQKLKGLESLPEMDRKNVHPELGALLAFAKIGKKVVFSEHYMVDLAEKFKEKALNQNISEDMIDATEAYSNKIAVHLSNWIDKDNYIETRTFDRFTSTKKPENWRETPPDFIEAMEPYWDNIRPLVIDSASIYKPKELPKYETSKDSDFYKMVYDVYEKSKNLDSLEIATAWFWDDNPNTTIHKGHLMAVIHKISPPGHWLNIIHQITEEENSSLFTASKAYTFTAIAMFDAIISSWHIKFKTDLVRPVTYIQEYIDPEWRPILQTPPFPEYTSGHSATSAAAAGILNTVFGNEYSFTDNTQLLFDVPERTYKSFDEAAWEVSLSRFYGGIHFRIGIEEGNKQGYFIANIVKNRLNE